jgi:hypothetical protein
MKRMAGDLSVSLKRDASIETGR